MLGGRAVQGTGGRLHSGDGEDIRPRLRLMWRIHEARQPDLLAIGRGYLWMSQSKSFQIFSLNSAAVMRPSPPSLVIEMFDQLHTWELHALDANLVGELERPNRQLAEVLRGHDHRGRRPRSSSGRSGRRRR